MDYLRQVEKRKAAVESYAFSILNIFVYLIHLIHQDFMRVSLSMHYVGYRFFRSGTAIGLAL